ETDTSRQDYVKLGNFYASAGNPLKAALMLRHAFELEMLDDALATRLAAHSRKMGLEDDAKAWKEAADFTRARRGPRPQAGPSRASSSTRSSPSATSPR